VSLIAALAARVWRRGSPCAHVEVEKMRWPHRCLPAHGFRENTPLVERCLHVPASRQPAAVRVGAS